MPSTTIQNEIDKLVYELCGLSEKENQIGKGG